MGEQFTVLVDLDSVTYDLTTPWLDWYNREAGDNKTMADITEWEWGFVKPGWEKKIYEFLHIEGMFFNLAPFPGAGEALRAVHDMGIKQLFASTVSTKTGAYEKQMAVERDFPFIGKKRVLVTGGEKAFKGDVLFDDGPHNRDAFDGISVRVDLQGSPYTQLGRSDLSMTNWSQYPKLVLEAMRLLPQLRLAQAGIV